MGRPGKHQQQEEGVEAAEGSLHGDVLDAVISRVSALDLLPASRVSKAWRAAVLSSLRRSPRRPPPWLVLHLRGRRGPAATHAFDPLSRGWRPIPRAHRYPSPAGPPHSPPPQVSTYASSQSSGTRFYALSPSGLALATDPFGIAWRQLLPPRFWRTDPVVAVVGPRVVVAGGTSELEDDANSVDVCDSCGGWEACEPMPEDFRWSAALSAAASEKRLYVMAKRAPFAASWFDPEAKQWGPTRRVRIPDPTVRHAAIGFGNGRLLLAGAGGTGTGPGQRVESVRLWAVDQETMEVEEELVGRMPREMVEGLVEEGGGRGLWSIGFLSEGEFAYVYNPSYLNEFFLCEFEEGGGCRWERIPRPACMEERPMHGVVFGCTQVAMEEYYHLSMAAKE